MGVEGVDSPIEVVLNSVPFVDFWREVVVSFFDFLELFKVFFLLHLFIVYTKPLSNKRYKQKPDQFLSFPQHNNLKNISCQGHSFTMYRSTSLGSVLLNHVPEGKNVVVINRRNCCHQLSLPQLAVLESNPPKLLVPVVPQSAFHHVHSHSDDVSGDQLGPVVGSCGVAVVPGLSVVDGPAIGSV